MSTHKASHAQSVHMSTHRGRSSDCDANLRYGHNWATAVHGSCFAVGFFPLEPWRSVRSSMKGIVKTTVDASRRGAVKRRHIYYINDVSVSSARCSRASTRYRSSRTWESPDRSSSAAQLVTSRDVVPHELTGP